MQRYKSKKVFSLEMAWDNGRIKISAHEKLSEDEKTMRHYEFKDIRDDEIRKMCASVVDLLNRSNQHGKINRETLKELQTAGQLLYDSLLTGRVKEKLAATNAENLIISIDDHLVQIPWEIMFDGSSFLCHRFNMGRVVSTGQRISEPAIRKIEKPVKMLVIADPRGDLEASYNEGVRLRDTLDRDHETIEVQLRTSLVDVKFLKGNLRDFDVVHYAGHADYDIHNPSDSGFLLQDGKLKASDIINMIGPAPLPSMVFSNACKSGHTDMWKVGEDYETEIYGLANAFLLAGVQHYIGTFWDVQDEPGLYFALDFYKELMDGAMVGEAIRKSRLRLIERYGEDSVIWASYMLYGDPTARYVALSGQEGKDERSGGLVTEDSEKAEETVVRGGIRGMEEVVAFPSKRHKWMLISSVLLLVLTILVAFSIFRQGKGLPALPKTVDMAKESAEAKDRQIDELVASLIKKYREDKKTGKEATAGVKRTGLPTLVFLNIKTHGINEADNEYIFNRVTNTLQDSKRVRVIEREIIDKLLRELKLSSSRLADPETTLRIGRILSANLISAGSIVRENNDWQASLRFIETETTSIKGALAEIIETREKKDVADMLGREILKKVREVYPLQGKILSFEGNSLVLDIGQRAGVTTGLKMKVLSGAGGAKVGELEIVLVEEDTSNARITSRRSEFKRGLKAEELL
jgi:CHAT domain-containing protein